MSSSSQSIVFDPQLILMRYYVSSLTLLVALCCLLFCASLCAQDSKPDPLVSQLNRKAQRGNIELAESVAALARIGQWEDVNQLLEKVADTDIKPAEMAVMASKIEPNVMVRIRQSDAVNDKAKEALLKIGKAAKAEAESETVLGTAIDSLDAKSVDKRISAIRTLLAGGKAATKVLVNTAVSTKPPVPRDDLLRTILRLGSDGQNALRQLALYGKTQQREQALRSLARIDRDASVTELLTALHAIDTSHSERSFARSQLQLIDTVAVNRRRAIEYLADELQTLRTIAANLDNDIETLTSWRVDDKRIGVVHQQTQAMVAAYRDAADAAARLRRIGSLDDATAAKVIAADLAYRIITDLDWGDEDQLKMYMDQAGELLTISIINRSLHESLAQRDVPAAVGLIRLMSKDAETPMGSQWLGSEGLMPSPLVRATISPNTRIRYEAATTLASFGETREYSGSSLVRQTYVEMLSLVDRPTTLLVETRPEVVVHQELMLQKLGFDTRVVTTVAALERSVAAGGDIRMIVSKTNLADAPPIELIDRIRRRSRGKEIPIVFYDTVNFKPDAQNGGTPIVWMDGPARSPAAYADLLERIDLRRRIAELSVLDRSFYREVAEDELGMSAINR